MNVVAALATVARAARTVLATADVRVWHAMLCRAVLDFSWRAAGQDGDRALCAPRTMMLLQLERHKSSECPRVVAYGSAGGVTAGERGLWGVRGEVDGFPSR